MEITGVVKDGRVEIPGEVRLREGARVRLIVDEKQLESAGAVERAPLTRDEVLDDIAWGLSDPFLR